VVAAEVLAAVVEMARLRHLPLRRITVRGHSVHSQRSRRGDGNGIQEWLLVSAPVAAPNHRILNPVTGGDRAIGIGRCQEVREDGYRQRCRSPA